MGDITLPGWTVGLFSVIMSILMTSIIGYLRALSGKVDELRLADARRGGATEIAEKLTASQEAAMLTRMEAVEQSIGKIHARIDKLFSAVADGSTEIRPHSF